MSDQITNEAVVERKRRGGWPRGKPRAGRAAPTPENVRAATDRVMADKSPMLGKMKARPNWESEDFVGVGVDGVDRLKVSPEKLAALHRDGVALQWVTKTVRGMEQPRELSQMTKGGWTPVHQSDFDGLLDGLFMSKGTDDVITVDDCMLVARPSAMQEKARESERKEANYAVQSTELKFKNGVAVHGGDHPTALSGNTIKRTMEQVRIPE